MTATAVAAVVAGVLLALLVIVGLWSWLRLIFAAIDRATALPAPPEGRHRGQQRATRRSSRLLRDGGDEPRA